MRRGFVLLLGFAGCVEAFPDISPADPPLPIDMLPSRDATPDRALDPPDGADLPDLPDRPPPDAGADAAPDPDTPRPPLPGELVINEVDYDQPGGDEAEFIELLNVGRVPLDLSTVKIDLINGALGIVYRNDFVGVPRLDPGRRVVIRNHEAPEVPAGVAVRQLFEGIEIQNGPNNGPEGDGIRLLVGDVIIDSLAYAGVADGSGEGDPAPADPPGERFSISRCADGGDSDDNAADFKQTFASPGRENDCREIDGDAR